MALEKIRIYKKHTHNDVEYNPGPEGIEIEVDEVSAKFIREHDVHKKPGVAAAAEPQHPAASTR